MVLYLARGIEDDHYWIVQEIDGVLTETPWRVEHEVAGWVLGASSGGLSGFAVRSGHGRG